ncbi:MAG: outer membrane beta-barrel protein [Flavobacteriales bacterium]|nr:outer membrane beta-barrel protein [Flavobacteriales bacterium]
MVLNITPFVRSLLVVLLDLALAGRLSAQQGPFNAGLVGGLNFAELVGEGNSDYFGPNVGIIGTARFARHGQLAMELLYSQNGEYILPEYYPALEYGNIALHHIEVPVHVDLLIGLLQHDAYYDWNLNVGVAYTQLFGYSVKDRVGNDVSDLVTYGNRRAMLLQAGTTYHFTQHLGLNIKASLPIRVDGLSWTWAARMMYLLG